jgi:hypothetical protein
MTCMTVNVASGFFDADQGSFLQMSMTHTWVGDVALRAYPRPVVAAVVLPTSSA